MQTRIGAYLPLESRRRRRFVIDTICTSWFWRRIASSSAVSLHASYLGGAHGRFLFQPRVGVRVSGPRRIREMAANGSLPATVLGRQARARRRIMLRSTAFAFMPSSPPTALGYLAALRSLPEAILVPNPPINGMLWLGSWDCRITGGDSVFLIYIGNVTPPE